MISQIMEAWNQLWEGVRISIEQKHKRMLESFKAVRLTGQEKQDKQIQIRLQ